MLLLQARGPPESRVVQPFMSHFINHFIICRQSWHLEIPPLVCLYCLKSNATKDTFSIFIEIWSIVNVMKANLAVDWTFFYKFKIIPHFPMANSTVPLEKFSQPTHTHTHTFRRWTRLIKLKAVAKVFHLIRPVFTASANLPQAQLCVDVFVNGVWWWPAGKFVGFFFYFFFFCYRNSVTFLSSNLLHSATVRCGKKVGNDPYLCWLKLDQ